MFIALVLMQSTLSSRRQFVNGSKGAWLVVARMVCLSIVMTVPLLIVGVIATLAIIINHLPVVRAQTSVAAVASIVLAVMMIRREVAILRRRLE